MITFFLIAAIVCVVAAAANIYFAQRTRRNILEYRDKSAKLDKKEQTLIEQQFQSTLQANLEKIKRIHVYANVAVDDPDDTAPDFPDKATYKKMKSKMGYYIVPKFRDHIVRAHKDGKTIYTLDLYVSPYE